MTRLASHSPISFCSTLVLKVPQNRIFGASNAHKIQLIDVLPFFWQGPYYMGRSYSPLTEPWCLFLLNLCRIEDRAPHDKSPGCSTPTDCWQYNIAADINCSQGDSYRKVLSLSANNQHIKQGVLLLSPSDLFDPLLILKHNACF